MESKNTWAALAEELTRSILGEKIIQTYRELEAEQEQRREHLRVVRRWLLVALSPLWVPVWLLILAIEALPVGFSCIRDFYVFLRFGP